MHQLNSKCSLNFSQKLIIEEIKLSICLQAVKKGTHHKTNTLLVLLKSKIIFIYLREHIFRNFST